VQGGIINLQRPIGVATNALILRPLSGASQTWLDLLVCLSRSTRSGHVRAQQDASFVPGSILFLCVVRVLALKSRIGGR
jgi:hypothetical protein